MQHRAAGAVEGRLAAPGARGRDGEAGGVEDHRRRCLGQQAGDDAGGDRLLEAGKEEGQRVEAARAQRGDQRVHRAQIAGLHQRPIEDERGHGRAHRPRTDHGVEVGAIETRPVEARAQQRRRLGPGRVVTDQAGGEGKQVTVVLGPAVDAVLPQPVRALGRHGAEPDELGVRLVVARHHGERDAAPPAALDNLLDTIGPIADAPQQPHQDELGPRDDFVHVEVDREVVAQVHEVGEA